MYERPHRFIFPGKGTIIVYNFKINYPCDNHGDSFASSGITTSMLVSKYLACIQSYDPR